MKEQRHDRRVGRILTDYAAQVVPNDLDLWPAIRARLQAREQQHRRARLLPTTRLGRAVAALSFFLVLGAATYGGMTLGEKLFTQVTGRWEQGFKADVVHKLGLSQVLNGVTVTLENAYILGHQIGVEFTVSGLPQPYYDSDGGYHSFSAVGERLTDQQGRLFPRIAGAGLSGRSEILNEELPPGTARYMLAFDGSAPPQELAPGVREKGPKLDILPGQKEFRLRFTTTVIEFISGPVDSTEARHAEVNPLAGPFVFEFGILVTAQE